jgi:hypothetical protein
MATNLPFGLCCAKNTKPNFPLPYEEKQKGKKTQLEFKIQELKVITTKLYLLQQLFQNYQA